MAELDAIDEVLRQTLEDSRLSRSESRALRAVIQEIGPNPHQHQVLTSRVFAIAEETLQGEENRKVLRWLKGVLSALDAAETAQPATAAEAKKTTKIPHAMA